MSLRGYLHQLDRRGDLVHVTTPISKTYEIAGVLKQLEPRPVLFECVTESPFRVMGNLFCSKASFADYFVICTGRSDTQVQAIADSVKQGMKKFGKALDIEGMTEGKWIVIDYGDVIVHIFQEEQRRYYDLDELWSAAPAMVIPEEFLWEGKGE